MFEQIHSYIVWWKGPNTELSLMGFLAQGNSDLLILGPTLVDATVTVYVSDKQKCLVFSKLSY